MARPLPPQPPVTAEPATGQGEPAGSMDASKSPLAASARLKFSSGSTFQIQHGVVSSEIDDELIVGDLLSNRYFKINATGAFIWDHLRKANRFSDLVEAVCTRYDVNPEAAEAALSDYLSDAIAAGILSAPSNKKQVWKVEI